MLAHRASARPLRSAGPEGPGERGETLIEMMVVIVVMGLGIVAILTGLLGLTRVTDSTAQMTRANLAAQSYAEQLKQPVLSSAATTSYKPCATAAGGANPYPAFSGTLPTGGATWTATVTAVEVATVPAPGTGTGSVTFSTACTTGTDTGLQRLTIEISSGARNFPAKETVRILKRQTSCTNIYSADYQNTDQGPC